MEEKPTVYLPYYEKLGSKYEKHSTKCVSITRRQFEALTKGLDIVCSRPPYIALTPHGPSSTPAFKYTYGAMIKGGVLQGVFLIKKGATIYVVK